MEIIRFQITSISNKMNMVKFFGDQTIAELHSKHILPFAEHVPKPKKQRLFNLAIEEAEKMFSSEPEPGMSSAEPETKVSTAESEPTVCITSTPAVPSLVKSFPVDASEATKLKALCEDLRQMVSNLPTIDRIM